MIYFIICMDNEPKGESKGDPQGQTDTLAKPGGNKENVRLANEAFKVAVGFFKSRGKGEDPRYSHLGSVADINHVCIYSDFGMTDLLRKSGCGEEQARTIQALYLPKLQGTIINSVITREGADIRPIIMLHEFIHRSAEQAGLTNKAVPFLEQMFKILDFPIEARKQMARYLPKEYKEQLAETKEIIEVFREGLTQWATLNLANRTVQFNPPVEDANYRDEVRAVDEFFHQILWSRGLTDDQIEELMLDLALTGDFSRLKAALPLSEELKKAGSKDDLHIYTLLHGIHGRCIAIESDRARDANPTP